MLAFHPNHKKYIYGQLKAGTLPRKIHTHCLAIKNFILKNETTYLKMRKISIMLCQLFLTNFLSEKGQKMLVCINP